MLSVVWTVCLLTAAPIVRPQEVALVHAPQKGSSSSTTIRCERELGGGDLTVVMNGQETPSQYLPELEFQVLDTRVITFVETIEERSDDGALAWLRRYDELTWINDGSFGMTMMGQVQEYPWMSDAKTQVAGSTVRFWTEDGEHFARESVEGAEGEVLEPLQAELGLQQLLPEEPIAVGERWRVDGETLGFLFEPGGDFSWELSPEAEQYMQLVVLERTHSGELELTLVELTEGDGRLARCTVEGTLVRETKQPGDLSQVPVVDGTATDHVEERWTVQGELTWNLAAHQPAALSLEGDLVQVTLTVRDPDQEGPTYESTFGIEGTYRVEVETHPLEERAIEAGGRAAATR